MESEKENKYLSCQRIRRKVKTPPRFRDQNASVKDSDHTKEDFSFSKLKGTVQTFERDQKEHLRRSATKKKKISSIIHLDCIKEAKRMKYSENNQHTGNAVVEDNQNTSEEFSFRKLKEMAANMEKNNSSALGVGGQLVPKSENDQKVSMDVNTNNSCTERRHEVDRTQRRSAFYGNSISVSDRSLTPLRYESRPSPHIKTPVRATKKEKEVPASMPILRKRDSRIQSSITKQAIGSKGRCYIPSNTYQMKDKIQVSEVKATNDKNASVQKLSQWLADDPFKKNKKPVLKKSDQIRSKSKVFESHEDNRNDSPTNIEQITISTTRKEREHFPSGKVSEGKSWLKGVFTDGAYEEEEEDRPLGVREKRLMFEPKSK